MSFQKENIKTTNVTIKSTNYTIAKLPDTIYLSLYYNSYSSLSYTMLKFVGSVNFHNVIAFRNIILLTGNGTLIISGSVKFSHAEATALIEI